MKDAERYFKATVNQLGWWSHKYGDVRYCIHCHGVLPKSETMPDFVLFCIPIMVECKESNATGRWSWKEDIGPDGNRMIQRKRLDPDGWLYIVLGEGKAPNGKGAWLVPWSHWIKVEELLTVYNQASIPFENTKQLRGGIELFNGYRLSWQDGIFIIPNLHPFWGVYSELLKAEFIKASRKAVEP